MGACVHPLDKRSGERNHNRAVLLCDRASISEATSIYLPMGEHGMVYRLLRLCAADHFSPQKPALIADNGFAH